MGFNDNDKLRLKELLLCEDGSVELIRCEEPLEDLFATLTFEPDTFNPTVNRSSYAWYHTTTF